MKARLEGVEGLLLSGGGDLAFESEKLNVGGDGVWASFGRRLPDAAEAEPGESNGNMFVLWLRRGV